MCTLVLAIFKRLLDAPMPTIATRNEGNIYKYDGFLLVKNRNILYNGQECCFEKWKRSAVF